MSSPATDQAPARSHFTTDEKKQRAATLAAGGLLTAAGARKGGPLGLASIVIGSNLLLEGARGNSPLFKALGLGRGSTSKAAVIPHGAGRKVEAAVTIDQSRDELFRFWRDFTNLPAFLDYLESVETIDQTRSRWRLKLPAGSLEWEAEIYQEHENELISWRSLPGAQVQHAGTVTFRDAVGGRGTVVRLVMDYSPPMGKLGQAVAMLLPQEPGRLAADALRRFKMLMETGEIATSRYQRETMANQAPRLDAANRQDGRNI